MLAGNNHGMPPLKRFVLAILATALLGASSAAPEYSIEAIHYGTTPGFAASDLIIGAPKSDKLDIYFILWLVRGGGRNILFDSGFHRAKFIKQWNVKDFVAPDEAVRRAGVKPEDVTDIVISHAHWDHMDGIDLFPKATVWIQKDEYRYYTEAAWQPDGHHGGIEPEDIQELVRLNIAGRLRLVDGDDVEIIPGIRAYSGARHTYASQYIRVEGHPSYVLASDNMYFYRNLSEHLASATFSEADHTANINNQTRMVELAGSADRVIPGHDQEEFKKFPTTGNVAKIK
jgi:glyoxylase-like metal-dependent hydrolase (beta-lactamase superfamily II)